MKKKRRTQKLSFVLALLMLISIFSGTMTTAAAASVSVSGFNDNSRIDVPKSGGISAVKIDDDVTITGSGFSDGYLLIDNVGTACTGDVLTIMSDSNPNAYGAISLVGSTVYLGTGSGTKQIGSIDETLNGEDGKDLKILLSTPLPNGGFESGEDNWTFYNDFVKLSGDSNTTTSWLWSSSSNYTRVSVKTENPYYNYNWVEPPDGSSSYMYMYLSALLDTAYGTMHGPKITSNEFEANKGDSVSLNYYAKNTGDKYDVYGYIRDTSTGATQQLFYQRGDETNGWQEVTAEITLPSSDNFVFEFICGSQDGTGGRVVSSELLIDNVRVLSDSVTASVVTNIARRVVLADVSQSPRTSALVRTYKITAVDSSGTSATSGTTAKVNINTYPDTPTVAMSAKSGTTDTINVSWSASGATAYDVYKDGAIWLSHTSVVSSTVTGLAPNQSCTVSAAGINDMGETNAVSLTKYSLAAVPTLNAVSSSTNSVVLEIGNEENTAGTAYRVEYSTDGDSWATASNYALTSTAGDTTSYTVTGLLPNTSYYFRVMARNGDGITTSYSDTASRITAPDAPNPLTAAAKSETSDSLNVFWTAPAGAASYDVFCDGTLAVDATSDTSTLLSGFEPNSAHDVYVVSTNTGGDSVDSGTVTRYTLAAVPMLTLGDATTNTISITINKNGNPQYTMYRLEQSVDGVSWTAIEDYTIYAGASDTMAYTAIELNSGTTYYYRIQARNEDSVDSAYSETVSKATLPTAPTGLTVTPGADTSDTLYVSWTAPVGAASYDVYRKAVGESSFTKIESEYTSTLLADTGLTPNREYSYYIVAKNASGDSEASETVSKYTFAAVPEISSSNSGDTNNLTITTGGNPQSESSANPDGTGYFIQYSTDDGTTWEDFGDWIYYLTPQHSGISSGLTYSYRVKAINGDGVETAYSGTASARSNTEPVITVSTPTEDVYRSAVSGYTGFTMTGTVADDDSDIVTITAVIDGVEKMTVVNATPEGTAWSLSWDIANDTISESTYSSIVINGSDGFGGNGQSTWGQLLYVDRSGPELPNISADTAWTNASSVPVTIAAGADMVSGADYTEYKLSGATTSDWTIYTEGFSVTAAGETTVTARTIDAVGNTGTEQTAVIKIDRTAPVGGSVEVYATDGTLGYTNSNIVNLVISAADSGGADAVPSEMQISNSENFTGCTWETYAQSRNNWTLTEGDGTNIVFIRFRDAVGNISAVISGAVVLDTAAPTIEISSPSSFSAKKGMTVTYGLTVSEACTLTGINSDDTSNIVITTAGDFSDTDIAAIKAGVTVTDVDETHRTITIEIPSTLSESEGTIGIKVSAGAAVDSSGNQSALTVGNASFVIDTIPPDNQDTLFPAGVTVQGGQGVTLAACSEDCDGGYDSDSVRFASADTYGTAYDGTDPANGTTITSTHGRSTVINAPTEPGTYYLYVIDAAGNVSNASTALLTVKNDGPTLTISGPSDAYVKSDSSVTFTVAYSADTTDITLAPTDVALVTTGTANAYVSIADVDAQPLFKTVTLYNLMGEGTVCIRIAAGSATDAQGNPALSSEVSDPVTVDNTAPCVAELSYLSDNLTDTAYAKKGDTLSLKFTANEELSAVTGTIGPDAVTFTKTTGDGGQSIWSATYTIPADTAMADGSQVPFTVIMTDMAGNTAQMVTQSETDFSVTLDFTAPVVSISGEKDSLGRYNDGATVTFDEGTCVLTNTVTSEQNTIDTGAVVYDEGSFSVTVTDSAGNTATDTFIVSYDSSVLAQDIADLDIAYEEGDSGDSITQDITLPIKSGSGADVVWEIVSGTAVSLEGIDSESSDAYNAVVTRPDNGDGDATVVLKATITIDGLTQYKEFTLTVKEKADDTDGLGNVRDDAKYARITYVYGDSQDSVTDDISLSDTGLLHGSALTWTSDSESIVISETAQDGVFTGTVTRPEIGEPDVTVTLTVTATATDGNNEVKTAECTFVLTVKAVELTDAEKASADYEYVDITYADGDSADGVSRDLTFVSAVPNGSTVIWESSDTAYVSDTGAVTQPENNEGNKDVTIIATITNGSATIKKTFSVTVVRAELTEAAALAQDVAALDIGYYGDDWAESVTTHVTLPTSGANDSVITWQTDNEAVIAADGTVMRGADSDITVTLTAAVTYGELQDTKIFTLIVKQTNNDDILQQILDDTDALQIVYADGDNNLSVTQNLTLRTAGANGCAIKWSSSDTDVVATDGTVTCSEGDESVTLTARVMKYAESVGYWINRTKQFTVIVSQDGYMVVDRDLDDVQIVYADGDSADSVTSTLYLPTTGSTGCVITWTSSNANYVTRTGKVTRPGPDDDDKSITLTATVKNTNTGESSSRVFEITILKMTDADAVEYAARKLTLSEAFTFSGDDIWESVTDLFLMLTSGAYDTSITWSSSNEDIVTISDTIDDGKQVATVTRPDSGDINVILTATITRNSTSVTKKYLLIVKQANSTKDVTREETGLEYDLSTSSENDQLPAYRTTVSHNGQQQFIDTVIIDPDIVDELVDNMNPNGDEASRTVTVNMPLIGDESSGNQTDEQAVEVPSDVLNTLSERNAQLTINSGFADITVPSSSVEELASSGNDLYFRINPIEEADEQEALANAAVIKLGSDTAMIGTPLMIETNYEKATYVTIPFGEAEITDYSNLKIYISHSDGTEEVARGTLVYKNGSEVPYGIKFLITSFSDFQIVEIEPNIVSSGSTSSEGNTISGSELEEQLSSGGSYTIGSDGALSAVFESGDIDLNSLYTRLGSGVSGSDVDITFVLRQQDDIANISGVVTPAGLTMVGTPITFGVQADYDGNTVELAAFEKYVDILVPIDDGSPITTAVRIGEDGSIIHIPTEVIVADGAYYAKIHSLITGTFALIYNPLEMDDVDGHWAQEDVNDMASRLVVDGVGDNLFSPDTDITRAEFAAILVRALGLLRGVGEVSFIDVSSEEWYCEYIQTAVYYGLVLGYDEDYFGPNDAITREQAMTMLTRAMGVTGLDASSATDALEDILSVFTDYKELSDYAVPGAASCVNAGIIVGLDDGSTLSPKTYITRAQAAATVRRLLKYSGLID